MGAGKRKVFQKFFQNMQNQTITELYTDDNKPKYSADPKDILISAQNFYKKLYTKERASKSANTEFTEFLSKITNRKKIFNEKFNL